MADTEANRKEDPPITPTITMKVDGPTDDCSTAKQDNSTSDMVNPEEFKICNPLNSVKTSSTNPFATDHNKFAKSILKPSLLSVSSSSPPSNPIIRQSGFNPFNKCTNDTKSDTNDKKHTNGEVLKFVPLIKTDSMSAESGTTNDNKNTSTNPVPAFVFGQNLQDRVVSGEAKSSEPSPSTSSVESNGSVSSSSDMLFSSAIKSETKTEPVKNKETKSLTQSAKEYEESRANKRKYDEVQVKTGEEEETNILNISCKLFSFDKTTSNWQERGRGTLRLNDYEVDDSHTGSRLVFRTAGSLRVILNTKIWAEMTVDKASEKSIRLTALDANGEIKVFLITATIDDSRQLYTHLQIRLQNEITLQKRKKSDPNNSEKK